MILTGEIPYNGVPTSAPPPYGVQDPEKQQEQAYNPGYTPGYTPAQTPGYTPYPMPAATTTVVVGRPPVSNPPSDYLVWSIITTVFCCFWFGIAAIIKSVRARDAISNGKLRIIV